MSRTALNTFRFSKALGDQSRPDYPRQITAAWCKVHEFIDDLISPDLLDRSEEQEIRANTLGD